MCHQHHQPQGHTRHVVTSTFALTSQPALRVPSMPWMRSGTPSRTPTSPAVDPTQLLTKIFALLPLAEQLNAELPDTLSACMWTTTQWGASPETSRNAHPADKCPLAGLFSRVQQEYCRPEDSKAAEHELAEFNFQFKDGFRYVSGFIGTDETHQQWLEYLRLTND